MGKISPRFSPQLVLQPLQRHGHSPAPGQHSLRGTASWQNSTSRTLWPTSEQREGSPQSDQIIIQIIASKVVVGAQFQAGAVHSNCGKLWKVVERGLVAREGGLQGSGLGNCRPISEAKRRSGRSLSEQLARSNQEVDHTSETTPWCCRNGWSTSHPSQHPAVPDDCR